MKNKIQKKENNQLITKSEVESKLNFLVKGQTNNSKQLQAIRNDLQKGFIGLALRNQELVELNKELTQQLGIVVAELNQIKKERQEKEIRKQARASRKRLPKREPMTAEIYKKLLQAASGKAVYQFNVLLSSSTSPATVAGNQIWLPGWLEAINRRL